MRRFLPLALLAAVLAALAAGCGGVSLDPVAKAAAKTADAGSFRFTFSVSFGIDLSGLGSALGGSSSSSGSSGQASQSQAFTGSGAWDAADRRLSVSADLGGKTLEGILDISAAAPAAYLKPPAGQDSKLPPGKTWLKLDLAQAAQQGGLDLGKLTSAQLDPKQLVEMLKQAGTSTKVGDETIDGVQTTHYRVEIDPKKALANQDAQKQKAGEQALKLTGVQTLPVDVWIDGDGYLRRVSAGIGGKGSLFSLSATLDLTDYGSDVTVDLPPADQVETATPNLLQLVPKTG